MFSPKTWFYRHLRQLRLALVLCLVVSYGTLLLLSIPILAYFDQIRALENPSSKLDESTANGFGLSSVNLPGDRPADDDSGHNVIKSSLANDNSVLQNTVRSSFSPVTVHSRLNTTVVFRESYKVGLDATVDGNASATTPTTGPWDLPAFPSPLDAWEQSKAPACNDQLVLYAREFARLRSVVVDRRFCVAKAKGGEEIGKVLRQDEYTEYYNIMRHCFQMECGRSDPIRYRFNGNNFLNTWISWMKTSGVQIDDGQTVTETGFTIAFVRREYANLYHTVNDWYNLFLVMVFFRKRPEQTNLLLIDAHPKGNLDPAWPVLFGSTRMLSAIPQRTLFMDMVWGMQGYNSVLKGSYHPKKAPPPLLEEFRQFFLDRFRLNATRTLNCANVSVLFIWRRDYLAHPRNPSGQVQRKIANEDELLTGLRRLHPNYRIEGVQIDNFSMKDQLKLVSEADILVGMHGAGLSHTLFVQPHGGTIELVPSYYGSENNHFVNLAKWRGLAALRWVNVDKRNELKDYRTIIPVPVVDALLAKVVGQICSESQQQRLERRKFENITEPIRFRPRNNRANNRVPGLKLKAELKHQQRPETPSIFNQH